MQIVGIIEPKLNLSQDHDQLAHLIEHMLLSDQNKKSLLPKAWYINGYTSELYSGVYAIQRSSTDSLLVDLSKLTLHEEDLKPSKACLKQELLEARIWSGKYQAFCEAVYAPGSPSLVNPWFATTGIEKASFKDIQALYQQKSDPQSLWLSYYHYLVPAYTGPYNTLKDLSPVTLGTPGAGLADVTIYYPITWTNHTYPGYAALAWSLDRQTDGELSCQLRNAGYIYSLRASIDHYSRCLVVSFTTKASNAPAAVKAATKRISTYKTPEEHTEKFQQFLKLIWENLITSRLYFLEEAYLGQVTIPPALWVYPNKPLKLAQKKVVIDYR